MSTASMGLSFANEKEYMTKAKIVISMPSQIFTLARKFQAASNGRIFIGEINKDPSIPENQIPVYIDGEDGNLTQVSQPIIINQAGFPVHDGQISKFVATDNHSMAIYDSYGTQQFYFPNVAKYDPYQWDRMVALLNRDYNNFTDGQLRIGSEKVASASNKDTLLLARKIRGTSDRHGFRDESILDEIVDYGGYGSVDVATTFRGTGRDEKGFDHHYAFQNRFNWEGTTNIGTIGGYLGRVNLTGSGTVQRVLELSIEDYKGDSPVKEHYGIRMKPLEKAERNYSFVSEGDNASMIHAGVVTFGFPLVPPTGDKGIHFGGTTLKGATQIGVQSSGAANADALVAYIAFLAKCSVLAGVKLPDAYGLKIENGGKGAGSEIERMTGIMIDALNSGLSNRGIQSLVPAGENNWNLFLHGAAKNYIAGNLGIGDHATTRNPTARVHINGGTKDTPPLKINTGTVTEAPQNGAFEFDGTNLFFTVGGVRKKVMLQ